MLIIPPGGYHAERWSRGVMMPSLGVGYLAAALRRDGFPVEVVDAHVEGLAGRALARRIRDSAPGIVGVSFTTETRFEGFETAKLAREVLPDALVVAGGPHVSLAAEDTLAHVTELDGAVRGEGEETLVEVARARSSGTSLAGIAGLSFRSGGEVQHNPDRPFVADLDSLPLPARDLVPPELYGFRLDIPGRGEVPAANMMTSRGCPYGCNFCSSRIMWGKRVRMRSPANIIEELREVLGQGKEAIWFFDDTFTVSPRRVFEFCDAVEAEKLSFHWFCEIRVDTVSRELLARMYELGCYKVGFGVESGSQRVIDEVIGKGIKIEQVRQVAAWCRELGIIMNPFFILSHPTETLDEARETMALMKEFGPDQDATISLLHIYPGTRLEQRAREEGVLPQGFSWSRPWVRGVVTLPSAQGNVPIFLDRMSWAEVSDLMFEWAEGKGYSVLKKIPKLLRHIHSWSDLKRYWVMSLAYLRRRLAGRRKR